MYLKRIRGSPFNAHAYVPETLTDVGPEVVVVVAGDGEIPHPATGLGRDVAAVGVGDGASPGAQRLALFLVQWHLFTKARPLALVTPAPPRSTREGRPAHDPTRLVSRSADAR